VRPPAGREAEVKRVLERALADRGLEVTSTAERLAAFLAVENTYLTTFQALGGLGLVLGSLGLAVVLLRSVWERRGELALLRAVGWSKAALGWLVLAENAFLLAVGLGVGAAAALLSITPQLASGEGAVPVRNLLLLFAGALAVGLLAGAVALAGALRAPIVPALRRE
jgi:putative ABC transport system permease protein